MEFQKKIKKERFFNVFNHKRGIKSFKKQWNGKMQRIFLGVKEH